MYYKTRDLSFQAKEFELYLVSNRETAFFSIEIKFTKDKIYHFSHFKVCNSVAFSTFTLLCNHHHYPIPEHFITQKETMYPLSSHKPQATTNLLSTSKDLSTLDISYKWNHTV